MRLQAAMITRVIKIGLDVIWYALVAFLVVGIPGWLIISSDMGSLVCVASVNFEPDAQQLDITAVGADSSLVITHHHTRQLETDIHGTVLIRSPNAWCGIFMITSVLFGAALTLAIVYRLRKLLTSLKRGSPFTSQNATRLRQIGLLLFFGTLADDLLVLFYLQYLNTLVITRGVVLRHSIDLSYLELALGLMVLVVAEWFRHGVELEEETALTV